MEVTSLILSQASLTYKNGNGTLGAVCLSPSNETDVLVPALNHILDKITPA